MAYNRQGEYRPPNPKKRPKHKPKRDPRGPIVIRVIVVQSDTKTGDRRVRCTVHNTIANSIARTLKRKTGPSWFVEMTRYQALATLTRETEHGPVEIGKWFATLPPNVQSVIGQGYDHFGIWRSDFTVKFEHIKENPNAQ